MSNPIPNSIQNCQQKRLSQLSQKFSIDKYSDLTSATTSSAGNISQNHLNINNHNNYAEPEYELKTEFRSKELEESRARITQMEKTMKWWSDCTTNWREKWRRVRDERNKAREESRLLFNKLETNNKELLLLKEEKYKFEFEIKRLRQEIKDLRTFCFNNHKKKSNEQLQNQLCPKCVSNTI